MKLIACLSAVFLTLMGCVTRNEAPERFVGKPVSSVLAAMPDHLRENRTDTNGRLYYFWNFDEIETVSVENGYAYYNTERPGMTTGIAYENQNRQRQCSVTAYYDPANMVTTSYRVHRSRGAQCSEMGRYLDGSAYQPIPGPGIVFSKPYTG